MWYLNIYWCCHFLLFEEMTCLLQEYEDHPTRLDKRCLEQLKKRKELWELSVQVGILFYRTESINVREYWRVNQKRTENNEGSIKKGQSRETGNIEYTRWNNEGSIKKGQSRETGNIEYTRWNNKGAIKKGQSRETGNIEYTRWNNKGSIKKGQSRETGNIEYTERRETKQEHNTT